MTLNFVMNLGRSRGAWSLRRCNDGTTLTPDRGNGANWACSLNLTHLQDTSHKSRWWGSLPEIMMTPLLFPFSRFHRTSALGSTGRHMGYLTKACPAELEQTCRFYSCLLLKPGASVCQHTLIGQTSYNLLTFYVLSKGFSIISGHHWHFRPRTIILGGRVLSGAL